MHSYEIIKRQHENMRIFFASLSSQMAFKFLDRATSESFIRSANVQAKKSFRNATETFIREKLQ